MKILHKEPVVYHVPVECPDWHEERTAPAGEYEYELIADGANIWFQAILPAKVTSASSRSRLGASYGEDRGNERIGEETKFIHRLGIISTFSDSLFFDFKPSVSDKELVKIHKWLLNLCELTEGLFQSSREEGWDHNSITLSVMNSRLSRLQDILEAMRRVARLKEMNEQSSSSK